MGIMQEFCAALYQEMQAYETKKTAKKKKLHPIRQQDITTIRKLLEAGEKQDPPNIRILHKSIVNYLNAMKVARLVGIISLSSDLRIQLSQVLDRPQFDPAQMMLTELQEQQAKQRHINTDLHKHLTKHEQEIDFLKTTLKQRDVLCEILKTRCTTLEVENEQLKESLKACADETTVQRFNQLHTKVSEQESTIIQLRAELEKEKRENQQLKAENSILKDTEKEAAPSPPHHSTEPRYYASPLKDQSPRQSKAIINTSTHTTENTVELKTFGS
jgi:hypothetical protein